MNLILQTLTSLPSTAAMSNGRDNLATSSSLLDPKASAMIDSVSDRLLPDLFFLFSSQINLLEQSSWSLKIMSFCQMSSLYAMDMLAATSLILLTGIVSMSPISISFSSRLCLASLSVDLPHLQENII